MAEEELFQSLKNTHHAFLNVIYENGNLIFPNGTIAFKDIPFEKLPIEIYAMNDTDFYNYVNNHYYEERAEEIDFVLQNFSLLNLPDDVIDKLKRFATDYALRWRLFNAEEEILHNDTVFITELAKRQKVIAEAFNRDTQAAICITEAYNDALMSSSQEKDALLVLKKPNLPATIDNNNLGISGFVSIFIILSVILIAGIFIAAKMIY